MKAASLSFPGKFFNLITCRHSEFCAQEAARVLKEGGVFLTQQVGETDKRNLKQAFGRGQHDGSEAGTLRNKTVSELEAAGFREIRVLEYDADEYYASPEDLIFLLKHTPIIPGFGETDADFAILDRFIEANWTGKGIRTNASRFLIIAEKRRNRQTGGPRR